jgi:hypothetical protein
MLGPVARTRTAVLVPCADTPSAEESKGLTLRVVCRWPGERATGSVAGDTRRNSMDARRTVVVGVDGSAQALRAVR